MTSPSPSQANGLLDVLVGHARHSGPPQRRRRHRSQKLSGFIPPALAASVEQRIRNGDAALWVIAGVAFLAGVARGAAVPQAEGRHRWLVAGGSACCMAGDPASTPRSAAIAVRDMAQRLPDGTIFVPKPTQRVLAIRTLFTAEQNHPGTVELPARVIPDPNASGYVQSSMGGRLMPPEGGFPRLGTKVEAGQVLAVVMPVIGAADLTSQQAQLREVEQEISLIETRLKRYRKLKDVVAESAVEDAELELAGLEGPAQVLAASRPSRRSWWHPFPASSPR